MTVGGVTAAGFSLNLFDAPKLVAVLPALGRETFEIYRYEPGPGVVSSMYSYSLS